MYKSLIEPYFRYCCPVWGATGNTALQKLQKLQNRAARIVTNSPYDAHSEPLLQRLGWPTVTQLIELETVKVVYKVLHNEAPDYLNSLFHKLSRFRAMEVQILLPGTGCEQRNFLKHGGARSDGKNSGDIEK